MQLDSQGTRTLEELKALKALRHTNNTWALEALGNLRHSGTQRALGHSVTQCTWALGLSGTWVLERHSKGTWALGHLGTQASGYLDTRGTLFSRLEITHGICSKLNFMFKN